MWESTSESTVDTTIWAVWHVSIVWSAPDCSSVTQCNPLNRLHIWLCLCCCTVRSISPLQFFFSHDIYIQLCSSTCDHEPVVKKLGDERNPSILFSGLIIVLAGEWKARMPTEMHTGKTMNREFQRERRPYWEPRESPFILYSGKDSGFICPILKTWLHWRWIRK